MIKVGLGFIIDLLHNRNRFFASPAQFVKLRMCHYLKSELIRKCKLCLTKILCEIHKPNYQNLDTSAKIWKPDFGSLTFKTYSARYPKNA